MALYEDILQIRAVDQHAHNVRKPESALPFEAAFSEANDPQVWARDTPHTMFFRRSVRQLAERLNCEPTAQAVKAARSSLSLEAWTKSCLEAANLSHLLLDDGLSPQDTLPWDWHQQFVSTKRLLRIEAVAQDLVGQHLSFEAFEEAFREILASSPPEVIGFKCIAAYRGGLNVPTADRASAKQHFVNSEGGRLASSPLYSYLVHTALAIANTRKLPVQFHTGFGDPDLALEQANPLLLRPLIERYPDCPFVLLHAGYPFVRETGFLASVYSNVWVDFGLALPFLSTAGMRACLAALLELSPLNKVLYSSDASLIPDLYFLGALNSRQVLSTVLETLVRDGDMNWQEALQAAGWTLAENATSLYGL